MEQPCTTCGANALFNVRTKPTCLPCYRRMLDEFEDLYVERVPIVFERENDLRNLYAVTNSIQHYKGAEKDERMDTANSLATKCRVPLPFPERHAQRHAHHQPLAASASGFSTPTRAELTQENDDLKAEVETLKERMRKAMEALGY